MSNRIESLNWVYWVLTIFLVGETLYVTFRLSSFLLAVALGEPSASNAWAAFSGFEVLSIALQVVAALLAGGIAVLLIVRRRSAAKWFPLLFLLAAIGYILAGMVSLPGAGGREISGFVGGVMGSVLQLALEYWAIRYICRPAHHRGVVASNTVMEVK